MKKDFQIQTVRIRRPQAYPIFREEFEEFKNDKTDTGENKAQ